MFRLLVQIEGKPRKNAKSNIIPESLMPEIEEDEREKIIKKNNLKTGSLNNYFFYLF